MVNMLMTFDKKLARKAAKSAFLVSLAVTMSACSTLGANKKEKLAYVERPAEQIYRQGAADARLKLELTHDHLAGKEMAVGRFYLKQNQQLAAIGRFKNVVRDYETTSQTEEALHRLVEAYVGLGIIGEAKKVGAVLGYNHPTSEWYADSYKLLAEYGVNLDDEVQKPRDRGYWSRLRERLF